MCRNSHAAQNEGFEVARAREGQALVTREFGSRRKDSVLGTHSLVGFADPTSPSAFVCVLAETKLRVAFPDAAQRQHGTRPVEEVTFVEGAYGYDDGLRLRRGETIRLKRLGRGTRATVLAIPGSAQPQPEPELAGVA